MPAQMKGFNKYGESEWFEGGRLPEGWSHADPTLTRKESIPQVDQEAKAAQDKADVEAQEAKDAQEVADKEAKEAKEAQSKADRLAKKKKK